MESSPYGETTLKLTSRGFYIWSITLPLLTKTESADSLALRLKQFDNSLKDTFPNYAKKGSGSIKTFDPF